MATTSSLIERTRTYLISTGREDRNLLAATIGTSDTSVTFTYDGEGIARGSVLAIGLELVYVWAMSADTRTATVQRGYDGSTAAAHTVGDIIQVDPTYSPFTIFSAINDELAALSAPSVGLFRERNVVLTYNSAYDGYDFAPTGLIGDGLDVRRETSGTRKRWPRINKWTVIRDADTTDFPSGTGIVLHETGESGFDIRVWYAAEYSPLATLTDDVLTTTGLQTRAHDIPPMGAAIRLVAGREIRRNRTDAQGDTRRAAEVPAGALNQSTRELRRVYDARLSQERARLHAEWPTRLR